MSWASVTAQRARCTGKTTEMAESTLRLNGTLVVAFEREAKRLRAKYPKLRVFPASQEPFILRGGAGGPLIFDPDAVHYICATLENKVRQLEDEKRDLTSKLERIKSIIVDPSPEIPF